MGPYGHQNFKMLLLQIAAALLSRRTLLIIRNAGYNWYSSFHSAKFYQIYGTLKF